MTDVDLLLGLEDERYRALIVGDWDSFAALCHPDLAYTHSSGTVDTLGSYLDKLRQGFYVYRAIEHPVTRIVVAGDTAMIVGQMYADLCVGGTDKRLANNATAIWVRGSAGWRLLSYQATPRPITP